MFNLLSLPAYRLLALAVGVTACGESLPKEETRYFFEYQTRVDAHHLPCGYSEEEECSDQIKREIRQYVGKVSIAEQKRMGEQMHQDFIHLISEDATYNARVEAILGRMRPYLSKQDFDHNIFVLEDSEFTAFTVPGGNIYLSIGLIEALPGDDELGFIIGHELGHSENSHTAELARLIKYVLRVAAVGDFGALHYHPAQKFDSSTQLQFLHLTANFSNTLLAGRANP